MNQDIHPSTERGTPASSIPALPGSPSLETDRPSPQSRRKAGHDHGEDEPHPPQYDSFMRIIRR